MRKKSLMKKSLALVLVASMAAAMAGCGGKSDSDSNTQTPANDSSSSQGESSGGSESTGGTDSTGGSESAGGETAAAGDLFGDEVDLNVMVWDRGDAAPNTTTEDNNLTKWIQQQVKEQFNINVTYTAVPRSESDDKVNIMMSGGTAPDIVFTYDQDLYYNYANSGALTDLTDVYAQYGSNIAKYCEEAQPIGLLGDARYAVMKQRGTESARHVSYIRKDWLDELGMEVPKTKAELGEYLQAVKDKNLGGSKTIPWGMSGRSDTEKGYLNFIGSYVNFETPCDEYVYNETYVVVAPGAKDGLKQLNEWYNAGLISQDFPTDTSEDVLKQDVANGSVGFVLDDVTARDDQFAVLNTEIGHETFIPVQCFDLPDGSYRTPFEQRYAMFVMIPATVSEEKVVAAMKYLNWMADPEVALNIRYTPEHEYDELGLPIDEPKEKKHEKGYPGTPDDLCIMNLNFEWANDADLNAKSAFINQSPQWATEEWYKSRSDVMEIGKYRYPVFAYKCEAEQTYGADIKTRMVGFVYKSICCPADQFEATYEAGYNELVNAGLQKILDGRTEFFNSQS